MDFDLAITIRRPPEAVWPVLDDIQAYAGTPGSPVPEMEKIPPGPVHVGTRWREVVRLLPGVTMTVWSEATAVEPDHRLEEDFRGPLMRGHLAYELEPVPAGCVLHQRETLTPQGPLRLVAGRMAGMLRPRLEHRLEEIRDLVEAGATTGAT